MRKLIFDWKNILVFLAIFIITFFTVFYRYIDYAAKTPERLKDLVVSESRDVPITEEELEIKKKKNFFENFIELKNYFNMDDLYMDYTSTKVRIIPLITIMSIFIYMNLKNKLLKYNIGRNVKFEKEKNKSKKLLALLTPVYSLVLVLILLTIALISSNLNFKKYWDFLFSKNDILSLIFVNNISVFIGKEIITFIGLYIFNLFVLELADRYETINAIIIMFMLIWLVPALTLNSSEILSNVNNYGIYGILTFGSSYSYTLIEIIIPIITTGLFIYWIKRLNTDEKEVV